MTKREFVKKCALHTNLSQQQVTDVMDYIVDSIKEELFKNGSVKCYGLGKLTLVKRKSRNHYNLQTGEIIMAREYTAVKYEPDVKMKLLLTD